MGADARLKSALMEVLQTKKIDDITVQELLDRADVSRPTFYRHYCDKYDLLAAAFDDMWDELHAELDTGDSLLKGISKSLLGYRDNIFLLRNALSSHDANNLKNRAREKAFEVFSQYLGNKSADMSDEDNRAALSIYCYGLIYNFVEWTKQVASISGDSFINQMMMAFPVCFEEYLPEEIRPKP